MVNSAPSTLDTLSEIATALNNDAALNTTLTNSIATKMPLAGGVFTGNVTYNDNVKAIFGNGSDLQIYHDGSNSYLKDAGTGSLLVESDSQVLFKTDTFTINNAANSENMLVATANGAVELYYDSSKKLETDPSGVKFNDDFYVLDGNKGYFGTGNDLQIYHNGSNSFIKNTTGDLVVPTQEFRITNAADTENLAKFIEDGAVELYHDNSKKLETTSSGVTVTGALTATGNITAFSDKTLKTDINTINDALGIVGKLRGVSYKWKENNEPSIGVIAQEVEQVIPEVVHTSEHNGKEVKSVDYGKMVGVLIEAIKELKAEVEELKGAK